MHLALFRFDPPANGLAIEGKGGKDRCMRAPRSIAVVCLIVASLVAVGATAASGHPKSNTSAGIKNVYHVVVLMQENRSFDSYLSRLHFEGQPQSSVESQKPNPNPSGGPPIHPFLTTTPCTTADLDHGWDATHNEIDGGRMDGFTAQNVDPT